MKEYIVNILGSFMVIVLFYVFAGVYGISEGSNDELTKSFKMIVECFIK